MAILAVSGGSWSKWPSVTFGDPRLRGQLRLARAEAARLEEHLENARIRSPIDFVTQDPLVGLGDSGHATSTLAAIRGTTASVMRLMRHRAEELRPGVYVRRFINGKDEDQPAFDHPLQELLDNPTRDPDDGTHTHSAAQMIGNAVVTIDAVGEQYWIILKDGASIPFNLQTPIPGTIEPMRIGGRIKRYRVSGTGLEISPKDIVRIWVPDENDLYTARGVMPRANKEINLDAFALGVWEQFYAKNALPTAFLMTEDGNETLPTQQEQKDFATNLLRNFHRQMGRLRGTLGWIPPRWKLFETKTQQEAASGVTMMEWSSQQVLEQWGISPTLIGRTEAVNRSNAETSQFAFDMRVMRPRMNRIADALTTQLASQYPQTADGVRLIVRFPEFVSRDKDFEMRRDESQLKSKLVSVNEVRKRNDDGLKPASWGDLPVGTIGEVAYTGEEQEDIALLASLGVPPEGTETPEPQPDGEDPATEEEEEETRQWLGGQRVLGTLRQARAHFGKDVEWQRQIQREERWTPKFQSRQSKVFGLQEKAVITDFLRGAGGPSDEVVGLSRAAGDDAQDLVDDIMPLQDVRWRTLFERVLAPVRTAAYVESAREALAPISTQAFIFTDAIRDTLRGQNLAHYTFVNESTRARLVEALTKSTAEGESVNQAARRISKVFGKRKNDSVAIARTEIGSATQVAQTEGYRQSGVVEKKQWHTSLDSDVRDTHLIEGQTVALDGKFRVGDELADAPLDVNLSAGNRIRCRCFVTPVFIGETGLEVVGG